MRVEGHEHQEAKDWSKLPIRSDWGRELVPEKDGTANKKGLRIR